MLKELLIYPSAADVSAWLSLDYPQQFADTRAILDCTEFHITTPGNTTSQATTFSSYEHHNIVKALLGVTPNGVITFASKVNRSSTPDRHIFQAECMSKIESGDAIMEDRGLMLQTLHSNMVQNYTTQFTRARSGGKGRIFNQKEILKTRDVARFRIHVERAIRRMKKV